MVLVRGTRDRVGGDERGAALVEFAFIIPLFMMLVLGMISGGVLYNQKMQLTHAAREGARYAATVPAEQIFTSGTWADNMRKLVVERSAGELDATSDICVALVEGNNTSGNPIKAVSNAHSTQPGVGNGECFNDQSSGEASRRVQVAVRKPGTLDAVFVNIDLTLSSQAGARHETST